MKKKKVIRWIPTAITICCLCVAIGFSSCCDEYNQQKYSIHDANGILYLTNEYKINGSCIEFKDCDCGNEEDKKIKLCGSYTIKELTTKNK